MIMIEKQAAVERLEEILSVKGIDMVQWGPVDYCMSIGRPGERNASEVKAVERKVFETALKMGVPPRAEITSVDQAKYYLDLGVRHFNIGMDLSILFSWWKTNGDELKKVLQGE
jgi:2-keto-3-deoxy-L-rhamnonate aldolase RhmA